LGARDRALFFAGDGKEYRIVVASPQEFRGFCALESCKKGWAEMTKLEQIADGQTDAVFEFISGGGAPTAADRESASLVQWCAYGDVSALKFLPSKGATLESLGDNIGLTAACFRGHRQLCRFLVEQGADVNRPEAKTGETPPAQCALQNGQTAI
jgi:hypothetical protein